MKFSIRDLLLVTVIAALAVGWWLDRLRLENIVHEANKAQAILKEENQILDLQRQISSKHLRELRERLLNSDASDPDEVRIK